MRKKILSLLLTACMVLSLLPAVSLPAAAYEPSVIEVDIDGAGSVVAEKYDNFTNGWNAAVGGSNTTNTTVKLLADWTATTAKLKYYQNNDNYTYDSTSFGTSEVKGFVSNVEYDSNLSAYTPTYGAGAICVPTGKTITLDLNGHTIDRALTADKATNGEVIYIDPTAKLTLTDSSTGTAGTITGGNTSSCGGGVYINKGTFEMNGGSISGNKATFNSKTNAHGCGGGVYINGGTFEMTGGSISGNTATNYGGGVYICGGTFTMTDGSISGNTASYQGGGVCTDGGGTFTMSGGNISGNTVNSDCGGGVYNDGTFTMNGGSISGNTAINGGGVYHNARTFTMQGGSISGNTATTGGGVFNGGGTFTITNSTIQGNVAASSGGGVYASHDVTVGGTTKITGNAHGANATANASDDATLGDGGAVDNLYLSISKVTCSTTTPLTDGASIGVTTQTKPGNGDPVDVTGSNSADYSGYFFSDLTTCRIQNSGSGSAQVVKLVKGAIKMTVTINGTTTNYADFVDGWNYAATNGTVSSPATVKLLADWTATSGSFGTGVGFGNGTDSGAGFILVPQDKSIILDLNGHTINRHLTTAQTDGEVICIASGEDTNHIFSKRAYLTVKDSSTEDTAQQGKITGGWNKVSGSERFDNGSGTAPGGTAGGTAGGIVVGDAESMLTLEGGQITGNQSENFGGGVSVQDYGDFVMSGGTISGNTAGCGGGGVALTGELWLTGGSIVGNTVTGTFTGKDINEQPVTNAGYGGGVCAFGKEPTIYMGGGTISGNVIKSSTSYGAGIYTFFDTYFGGDAKVNNNQKGERAVAKTSGAATGGSNSNCYILPYGSVYYFVFAYSLHKGDDDTQYPLRDDASIGIELDSNPTPTQPVELNAIQIHNPTKYPKYASDTDYSTYFHCDNSQYAVKKSAAGAYTLQYAVASTSDIFGAKFYRPQVWDCQRSPAFPVAGHSFRLSGLKAPYDENLKKVNFADQANDYVTFKYLSTVAELDDTVENRIVNSLKRYTGATDVDIRAAAVVKETLHSGTNQETETTLSSIGLVWALGDDGFLYTAMNGALKYSGGVGTYVTFAAHKSDDSIIYTPDKTEPYTYDEIIADENKLAQQDGTPTAPAAVTYQELIKVVNDSGAAVSGAMVEILVNDAMYSGTTDANGCVQFVDLPVQTVDEAAVKTDSGTLANYSAVASPEDVLVYDGTDSGSQQAKVTATVKYGTDGNDKVGGTVSCVGAGTTTNGTAYSLTKDDTARFIFKPDSGYKVSSVTWNDADQPAAVTEGYFSSKVTANSTLAVTFAPYTPKSIFEIHYTTAEVFDVQRSPAFPDTGDSSIRFSWLAQPYDTNLDHITLGAGEYIKFDKVKSVADAGKKDEYTESLRWWTDATEIGTAALVKENVYKNVDGTPTLQRTLGTGLIWCYNDPSKGFMFTTMDGDLGDCGGVGSYVSFNALQYGSSVTQLTDSAEPLQWRATDPQGQPEKSGGDTVDETQEVTFDFAGKVLNATTKDPVTTTTPVILTWAGQNYPTTTDANGRFVVSGLPYIANGDYTVTINSKTFNGVLPVPSGVENSQTRRETPTAPEIVFLLNSASGAITAGTTHTITVNKSEGGSVSPAGTVQVSEGGTARIGFAPSSGYCISKVEIDGAEIAAAKSDGYYKFTGVTGVHTVAVTFTSNGGGYTPSTPDTGKAEPVIVDGTEHDIGTKTTTDTTTTVTVDNSKLQEQLESASESVVVPITSKTDTTVAQLVVKNVEDMAEKDMTLSVDIGKVQYNIPSKAVQTSEVMQALGATDPSKVPVNVTITQLKNEDVTIQNGTLQVPPVQFTVTATYGGKTVETSVFTQYCSRVIELSDGTDLSKITTAVVKEPDGAERHVPTFVYSKEGKDYAIINSLTNSTYALIYNNQSFADAAGKWYQNIVSEMASREILFGRDTGVFDGDASITRAEFAAVLVRALGLPANGTSKFTDVASTDWYAGAVGTASGYGLVLGYTDGSFQPNSNITRQEAMAMMQRAAKVAEFSGKTSELTAFSDAASVSDWAISAAQYNVGSGLIVGDNGQLRPNDAITRAESATVVLRLLQKAGLVDVRSAT